MLWESADAEPGVLFHLQLLWQTSRVLWRASICALLASTLVAFLVPRPLRISHPADAARGAVRCRPGMLAAMAGPCRRERSQWNCRRSAGGSNSGALFVGILGSQTVEDRLIRQFNLRPGLLGFKDRRRAGNWPSILRSPRIARAASSPSDSPITTRSAPRPSLAPM